MKRIIYGSLSVLTAVSAVFTAAMAEGMVIANPTSRPNAPSISQNIGQLPPDTVPIPAPVTKPSAGDETLLEEDATGTVEEDTVEDGTAEAPLVTPDSDMQTLPSPGATEFTPRPGTPTAPAPTTPEVPAVPSAVPLSPDAPAGEAPSMPVDGVPSDELPVEEDAPFEDDSLESVPTPAPLPPAPTAPVTPSAPITPSDPFDPAEGDVFEEDVMEENGFEEDGFEEDVMEDGSFEEPTPLGDTSDRLIGKGFTPFQLSYLAIGGGLKEVGIPGGNQLINAYDAGKVSAEDIVNAGAMTKRLGTDANDEADYTEAVDRFLKLLSRQSLNS